MAHKITDACVSCGTCIENCPVEAIVQGDTQYEINADVCVDCGACGDCVDLCADCKDICKDCAGGWCP